MTSLVFGNFCFDFSSYRLGLKLRLRLGLGFLGFTTKCMRARNMCPAFSFYFSIKLLTTTLRFMHLHSSGNQKNIKNFGKVQVLTLVKLYIYSNCYYNVPIGTFVTNKTKQFCKNHYLL